MNGCLDLISCLLRNLGRQFFACHLNPSATCSNDKMSALCPHYIQLFFVFLIIHTDHFSTKIKCLCWKQSKTWVYGRSLAWISGSNPASGVDFCLFLTFCVVRKRSLPLIDYLSGGVVLSAVCLSVILKPRQWGGRCPPRAEGEKWRENLIHVKYEISLHNIYKF
jgi:hypothetical protein